MFLQKQNLESIIVLEAIDAFFDKNRDTKNSKMNISFSGAPQRARLL